MKNTLKIIDGAQGEGGGQILRSTLSLSMCTGTPVRIVNIRAGRRKSGLLRQHLTCVRASQEICNASVQGAELGSAEVTFAPGNITPGNYDFAIGSAGSTSLVFQTVIPALLMAGENSTVRLHGGTHNGLAPSYDFIKLCFIPAMQKIGYRIGAEIEAYGFMPNGGGRWVATVSPGTESKPFELTTVNPWVNRAAVVTQSGIDRSVAERELVRVQKKLGWTSGELHIRQVDSIGPGNIVSLRVNDGDAVEIVDVVGSKSVKAERVAGKAVVRLKRFIDSGAAVGEHLCDQLLLPLALNKGGRFTTVKPSLHTLTNIDVIREFIDCSIELTEHGNDLFEVVVGV